MCVRAETDLMTPFLDMYLFAYKYFPVAAILFEKFLVIRPTTETSLVGLFKDPYTVPIIRPPLPEAYLRNQILPILRRRVGNETVRELIEASDSKEECVLVDSLSTAYKSNSYRVKSKYWRIYTRVRH